MYYTALVIYDNNRNLQTSNVMWKYLFTFSNMDVPFNIFIDCTDFRSNANNM